MVEKLNTSEILLARLSEGLDSTAKMTQALLSDLRESELDFSAMKTELNILKENVKGLAELIRDGGTSSLLTKVALIEQSIDSIDKWMNNHVDVHNRMKKDFGDVRNQLQEIEHRLGTVELALQQIDREAKEKARELRATADREQDLAYEQKKNDEKLRAEKQSAFVKIIAAILIGVIGLIGGYLANSCSTKSYNLNTTGIRTPIVTSSVPLQNH